MRILLLSQFYDPEPGFKTHQFARELLARGHEVQVITGFPNYPRGQIYPGYKQRLWQREFLDNVPVLRLPLYPDHSRSGVARAFNYLSFAATVSLLGPALCRPADIMWVYHPPLTIGFPAFLLSRLRRIPMVYEIQDMWPETVVSTGMLSEGPATRLLAMFAQFIYARASAITVISPGFRKNLIAKGVPPEKIHVIPNWADEDLYRPVPRNEKLALEYGLTGRFNIMYGGNIGAAQALGNLLEAAQLLSDRPQLQFVLIGDGLEAAALRRQAEERGLNNIRFIDHQPAERMPQFFALADLLLTHLKRDHLFSITIPSKTLAYLACGRPILAAVEGDAANVVREAGAGIVCQPEDPVALAQAVCTLLDTPAEVRERMGQAGRQAFLQLYTRRVLIDHYETIFSNLAPHAVTNVTSILESQQ